MYEIKHIDVWVMTRYTTAFAFIASAIASLIGLAMFMYESMSRFTYGYGSRLRLEDFVLFLATPLCVALFTFGATALFGALYNVAAEKTTGLQVDLEFMEEKDSHDVGKSA